MHFQIVPFICNFKNKDNLSLHGALALPFTHKMILKILTAPQEEPFTHEMQLSITVPHYLMSRRRIAGAAKVTANLRYQFNHRP
jgi:hypothetical protein